MKLSFVIENKPKKAPRKKNGSGENSGKKLCAEESIPAGCITAKAVTGAGARAIWAGWASMSCWWLMRGSGV